MHAEGNSNVLITYLSFWSILMTNLSSLRLLNSVESTACKNLHSVLAIYIKRLL